MGFEVTADSYGRFMGGYSEPLAERFADWAGVAGGQRALDVGCGPGALTARLVERLGVENVAAIDPSGRFVAAVQARLPGLDVRRAAAEQIPFPDGIFDLTSAQLVVHFMRDPVAGLREMARVTRAGGTVAACVWDHAGRRGPLATFWEAVNQLDPEAPDESELAGAREGHLRELALAAGLSDVESAMLTVTRRFPTFADWWEPFTLGVGPAGEYVAALGRGGQAALRLRCERLLPPAPFELTASAWTVRGVA